MGRLGRVGPYTLLDRLGRGGMGEVYLASSRRGENVALKMLHEVVDADSEARIRLEREVRALRRVESPYVARVVDADLEGDRPYLVMEHIEGDTLLERVRRDGPLEGAGLLTLAQGLATALSIIHAAGVVHRDLKPANVLVNSEDEPVLIDFGIAHVLDATRLTLTGTFLGTPSYAAPELFADEPVGEPADVHAWAATVAFAATGRPTFGGGTVEAQMYAILNGLADLEGIPAALLPLIRAALHREAVKRPTAALLAGRIGRLARATPSEPASFKAVRPAAEKADSSAAKKPESRSKPGAKAEDPARGGRSTTKAAKTAKLTEPSRGPRAATGTDESAGSARGARPATGDGTSRGGRQVPAAGESSRSGRSGSATGESPRSGRQGSAVGDPSRGGRSGARRVSPPGLGRLPRGRGAEPPGGRPKAGRPTVRRRWSSRRRAGRGRCPRGTRRCSCWRCWPFPAWWPR